jgi:threonine synthase
MKSWEDRMKRLGSCFVIGVLVAAGSAFAEKPQWVEKKADKTAAKAVGKQAPSSELLLLEDVEHEDKSGMKAKSKHDQERKAKKVKEREGAAAQETSKAASKGLEKQREKKPEQEMKELGKGSEQGQAARDEHRKKWWRFWE